MTAPRHLPPPTDSAQAAGGRKRPLILTCLLIAAVLLVYVGIAALLVLLVSRNGTYPSGSDTMFYLHRGNFLYHSITEEGNWYPLIDMSWYNGVQTWRYWSPVTAIFLAAGQAIAGGNIFDSYLLNVGFFYLLGAVIWLIIGCTHKRPWMGAFLGAIWFFVPMNLFMCFSEGVLARSMAMPFLPWFLVAVHDYLYQPTRRRWRALPQVVLSMVCIILFHIGWAGMLAIALLIYLAFYFIININKEDRVGVFPMLLCIILAFAITGIWTYPSLQGGITGIDTSAIMRGYFQPLGMSINPFYGATSLHNWNRWNNIGGLPYFGFVAFLLSAFGLLFSRNRTSPGFATSLAICLLTSSAVYPLLVRFPGASYLWMLRFISIALTFLFVSFFFWRSLKKGLQAFVCLLLVAECVLSFGLFLGDGSGTLPEDRYTELSKEPLIQAAKEITTQRCSIVEPRGGVADGVYMLASFGPDAVPTSYGQGVQSAVNYTNVVQVNQAAEDEQFLYMFDRLLEMGNDSVIVPIISLGENFTDTRALDNAAAEVGYSLVAHNDKFRLYHFSAPDTFGVVSTYRAAAIGTGAGAIALGFPAVEELEDIQLDNYTVKELEKYDVIYLAGFTYEELTDAEALVRTLSQQGTRILIMADGIPDDEHTGSKTFLGVSCNTVNFQNGYPALINLIDNEVLYCQLFPDGYSQDWKTVYLNGLTNIWGTITDVPEGKMDFYGTGENDNIIFIGLALTYHYSLTQDPVVGNLLSHALDLSPRELPKREIVPIEVDYHHNVITVDSPRDNVNTTLGYHDIFRADREIRQEQNMTVVNKGRTVIELTYPYLAISAGATIVGLIITILYLAVMRRRLNYLAWKQEEAARKALEPPQEIILPPDDDDDEPEIPHETLPALSSETGPEAPSETPAETPAETETSPETAVEEPAETEPESPPQEPPVEEPAPETEPETPPAP